MQTISSLSKAIEAYRKKSNARLAILEERRRELIRNYQLECMQCHRKIALPAWTFNQRKVFVRQSGIISDGYWRDDKTETSILVCPACGGGRAIHEHPKHCVIIGMLGVDIDEVELKKIFTKYAVIRRC